MNNLFVTEIAGGAFSSVESLKYIQFTTRISYIGPMAFQDTYMHGFDLPDTNNPIKLGRYAFSEMNLRDNNFSNEVKIIPQNMSIIPVGCFSENWSLERVRFPYVKKIQSEAFSNTSISEIFITTHLKEIEANAFKLHDILQNSFIVKFQPQLFSVNRGTNTNLINYDISYDKISIDTFYYDTSTSFEIYDVDPSSSWKTFFTNISSSTNVTFNSSLPPNVNPVIHLGKSISNHILFPDYCEIYTDRRRVGDEDSFFVIKDTINNIYGEYLLDNPSQDLAVFYVTNKIYDISLNAKFDVSSTAWYDAGVLNFFYTNGSDILEFPNNTIRVMKKPTGHSLNFKLEVLQPFIETIYIYIDVPFYKTIHTAYLRLNYSYDIPIDKKIHPLTCTGKNVILYSNNYVILNPSGEVTPTNISDNNTYNNIIDDIIYFGIGTDFTDSSYSITLVQNLEMGYVDYNSGYIEKDYDISMDVRYTDTRSVINRTLFLDFLFNTSNTNIDASSYLNPILSWNGLFEISSINQGYYWEDASSIKLYLNNRSVTCYFVKYPFGHPNDSISGEIIDPGAQYPPLPTYFTHYTDSR